jgi:hypothetical protein
MTDLALTARPAKSGPGGTPQRIRIRALRASALRASALVAALALGATCAFGGPKERPRAKARTARVAMPAPALFPDPASVPGLGEIGRGKAVIFSPDFSVPTNRAFYEALGFVYLEDASWTRMLDALAAHNASRPEERVDTLLVACHGANGNGLKVQVSKRVAAARSYISIGGLKERLERAGVFTCVLTACNAGRLFRPRIVDRLDPNNGDPLFLPATLGIVNASPEYDSSRSPVMVLRRADSHIETTVEGDLAELAPNARERLLRELAARTGEPVRFVVSDLFVQLLVRDPQLRLAAAGFAAVPSRRSHSRGVSDRLFEEFLRFVESAAERETLSEMAQARPTPPPPLKEPVTFVAVPVPFMP